MTAGLARPDDARMARVFGSGTLRRAIVIASGGALGLLGACAEVPPAPSASLSSAASPPAATQASGGDERVARTITRHRQLATQYRQAGDLAAAAAQWQILGLLDPTDVSSRNELAATRAAIQQGVQDALAQGNAALKRGDPDRAADAMLRALALDPQNVDAAQSLREIEKRRAARTQASRAAKASELAAGARSLQGTTNAAGTPKGGASGRSATPDPADAYLLEPPDLVPKDARPPNDSPGARSAK